MAIPKAPSSAGTAGRRLWRSVLSEYQLSGGDLTLLERAVVMVDQLDALEKMIYASGPLIRDRDGNPVPNPASQQHRLLSVAMGRLLACARVVGDEVPGEARLQHRAGFRGLKAVP
jgi:hypothetical protein